jgi:hypothetical protein
VIEILNTKMIDELIGGWATRTAELSEEGPRLPVNVLLGEAIDVAEVIEANFEERTSKGKTVPGLAPFLQTGGLTDATSTELRELQISANTVDSRYYNLVRAQEGTTMEDAEAVLRELRFSLSFVLEDGEHPEGEAQLDRLRAKEDESESQDGVALLLDNYRELARQHLGELSKIPDFDPKLIDRAIRVAQGLRQRSADALMGKTEREQRELLALRNRLLTAISDRLREARRVIRYVFRDHPDIVRKATSEYSRGKRKKQNARRDASPDRSSGAEVDQVGDSSS